MSALAVMPLHEQYQADEDPDLLRASSMTGSIRWLEIYRAYLLAERLDKAQSEAHKEIVASWALALGMTAGTLISHLRWARLIHLQDLVSVFEEENIGEQEWTTRIGTSHLKAIGRAKDQGTAWEMPFTSRERACWVRRAYHANLSVAELEQMLRDHDLLPPKRPSKLAPPTKLPTTATAMLHCISGALVDQDKDIGLVLSAEAATKPVRVGRALRKLADLLDENYPGAEFRLVEGEAKQGVPT